MTAPLPETTELNLRLARQGDLAAIVAIYNAAIPGRQATADTSPVSVEDRLQWFADHQVPERPLWVATPLGDDDAVLGWASFSTFYGRPAYRGTVELAVYVAPDAQGRGIAKALVKQLLIQAPALHIHTVLGYVFSHNHPSLALLTGMGFEPWGQLPHVAVLDDQHRSLTIVGKKIA
ncbi:GNAT family N-acetyltransferase [Salinispirillum marinum]|uniref:GNAT family N-acetyltransferase n=2 Tax=Saccharospirillaceae TaxID=255527 RepID=A0ABV8BAF8_9GAMM